jgi:hypothetical protein
VIVVFQHDAAARAGRAQHCPYDLRRVCDVLENEPRVDNVKGSPFVFGER